MVRFNAAMIFRIAYRKLSFIADRPILSQHTGNLNRTPTRPPAGYKIKIKERNVSPSKPDLILHPECGQNKRAQSGLKGEPMGSSRLATYGVPKEGQPMGLPRLTTP